MEKRIISLFMLFCGCLLALPNAWINEIHYDNAGADVNEFVEVLVADPESCSLGDLTLYMYNGYNGEPYCLDCISDFEPGDRVGPYQFYTWFQRGIQNDMEGMILVYHDTLVDIIAYEGTFTGTKEPAKDIEFPDIGVAEASSAPVTGSIYLTGLPGDLWDYTESSTPGSPNEGQVLAEIPTAAELGWFRAEVSQRSVLLRWRSESESENATWNLYRDGSLLARIEAAGSTSSPREYSYKDIFSCTRKYCHYKLSHTDYGGVEVFCDSIRVLLPVSADKKLAFRMEALFPNPCNPQTVIPLVMKESGELHIDLFDLCGKHLGQIFADNVQAGRLEIPLNLENIPSGRYYIKCSCRHQTETRRITLLK